VVLGSDVVVVRYKDEWKNQYKHNEKEEVSTGNGESDAPRL